MEGEPFSKGGLVYFWALMQDWLSSEKKSSLYIPVKQPKVLGLLISPVREAGLP